jgi:alkylation response protein AidB-like acyl-CoA dehydrogenase
MTTTQPVERASTPAEVLPDDMLARFDERAPIYDRDNRFFDEDFAELQASGFLAIAIPTAFGGAGASLDEYSRLLRRLSYHAPATALAVNMHIYWTGVAADLLRAGDDSCRFILDKAAAGEVLCALHGESGNDLGLVLSTASAVRTDGGWLVSGHKIFGSLTPVWTLGGFHAMDTSDPAAPKIVHGFVPRGTQGVQIVDTWDTLGMRATQSQDTLLDEAFVPDELVALVCPTGFAGASLFHVSLFAWALLGFASIYLGAAKRAYDITLEQMPRRTSIALTNSMAHHPEVQHNVAEMRMAHDAAEALLERTTADWADGVEHVDWPVRLISARQTVINTAFDIVDRALDLSGGAGAFKRSRIEQLFRDVRMGRFHPGNTLLAHELIGKLCLGIDPDAAQRWG